MKIRIKPVPSNQVSSEKGMPAPVADLAFVGNDIPVYKNNTEHLKAYKNISWVYKAVKKNAEKVSELVLHLMRHKATAATKSRNMDGGEVEEVFDHPVLELLANVNEMMTFRDLIMMNQAFLELVGEAYIAVIYSGNGKNRKPAELWPLRPDKVTVDVDEKTGVIKGYVYKPRADMEVKLKPDEVIPLHEFDPMNPYRGIGAVAAIASVGDADFFASKWNRNFFMNAAMPVMAILLEDNVSKESKERFESSWRSNYEGVDNAHRTAIVKGVKDIKTNLSRTHTEMGFLDLRKANRDEILAVFGTPLILFGLGTEINRATADAAIYVWLLSEIKPKQTKWVEVLTEYLLAYYPDSVGYFFDFEDPVPENHEVKLNEAKAQGIPWMTINELRTIYGKEPIDGGDVLYKPLNMTPIENQSTDEIKLYRSKTLSFKSGLGRVPHKKELINRRNKIFSALVKSKPEFAQLISKMMAPKGKVYSEADKESIWKAVINLSSSSEELINKQLKKLFKEQEQLVLNRLAEEQRSAKSKKKKFTVKAVADDPFVIAEWEVRFKDAVRPILLQLVKTVGLDAFEQISGGEFDATVAQVLNFIESEGLLFARIANETTAEKIRTELQEGELRGEGADALTERVKKVYTEATESRAAAIARTETTRANNFARLEAYRQSGVVTKYEWFTAADERVCEFCGPMNGRIVGLGQKFFSQGDEMTVSVQNEDGTEGERTLVFDKYDVAFPPLHPQCRCTTVPIIE